MLRKPMQPLQMIRTARNWASRIKTDVVALYLAGRDPRTPRLAKAVAIAVAAYASSPIDLIPDFIPVLGYLDDLLIVPLGILLAVRLIPVDLMAEFRAGSAARGKLPAHRMAAVIVVAIWLGGLAVAVCWLTRRMG
jgi:uncharacterized membrane protein YkvA (DUF1232 family)